MMIHPAAAGFLAECVQHTCDDRTRDLIRDDATDEQAQQMGELKILLQKRAAKTALLKGVVSTGLAAVQKVRTMTIKTASQLSRSTPSESDKKVQQTNTTEDARRRPDRMVTRAFEKTIKEAPSKATRAAGDVLDASSKQDRERGRLAGASQGRAREQQRRSTRALDQRQDELRSIASMADSLSRA